jgi:release factor glutamine methyltransferase
LDIQSLKYKAGKALELLYSHRDIENILFQLIEHISGYTKLEIYTNYEWHLSASQQQEFEFALTRLSNSEPLQYIIGYVDFLGLDINVGTDVLIPRPETEELVSWIYDDHKKAGKYKILDLGTGSGCIALALKKHFINADICASDISLRALEYAKNNAKNNALELSFLCADILQPSVLSFFRNSLSIIVSNPPYITNKELFELNLKYEPSLALEVPDNDPLLFYRAIAKHSKEVLVDGGLLYVESSEFYADEVDLMFKEEGLKNSIIKLDLQGKKRMIRAEYSAK